MSRRRSTTFLAVLAGASLIAAACSGDDDDEAITEGTSESTSAAAEPEGTTAGTEAEGETTEPEGTEPDGTEPDTTEGEAPAGAENVGVEGGSGCGIPHGPYDEAESEPAGEVRVAWNDPLLSFNSSSARGSAIANTNPLYLMNANEFSYYDGELNFINNDQFGTCTIDSLDPLTITYTINEGVTWSDGTQIDAADLILEWGAISTVFNDGASVVASDGTTANADADGLPVVLDPSGAVVADADVPYDPEGDGSLPEGYTYQESAGITFDAADPSMLLVTEFPEISEDGLSVTGTWDTFFVDYQTQGFEVGLPAHVVGRLALGIEDPAEAKQAIIDAFQNNDAAAIKPISETWNTGFDATSLPDDPGIYLSNGPYLLTSYDEVSQMTFEANPDYTWGPQPQIQTIVYRVIGDPAAAVQALQNEEIDVIAPQSTADILTQVEALADRGIEYRTADGATYEHVDLVFNNGGPFDPATYGDDEEAALKVRQAFMKTIPRQEIVDRLIVPLNPEAQLRDSFTQVPGAPDYDFIVADNGSAEYAEVDIEGAQALLDEVGVAEPIDVRFLFAANNPRRTNEYELIRDSAAQVGFNLIDNSSPTWGQELSNNAEYDASLFGWQSTSVDVAGTNANFVTDGQNNYGGSSNAEIDELYAQLQSSIDVEEYPDLLLLIEQQLWSSGFGVTIFQFPDLTAWNGNYVTNVGSIPLAPTVFYNFWEWQAP